MEQSNKTPQDRATPTSGDFPARCDRCPYSGGVDFTTMFKWFAEEGKLGHPCHKPSAEYAPCIGAVEFRECVESRERAARAEMQREVHEAVLAMAEICTKGEFVEYMKRVVAQDNEAAAARHPTSSTAPKEE